MTTSVLEALIQLFALFAAGRGKEGIAMGRRHASRYMQRQMPKMHLEDSLQRFDELVNVFQTMPGQGEDMMAKRLSKLSVKLLRTCAQINKGSNCTKSTSWSSACSNFCVNCQTLKQARSFSAQLWTLSTWRTTPTRPCSCW